MAHVNLENASISRWHMAFAHLERMRSVRALHGQVIDCAGNFVQDSANPKPRTGSDDSLRDVPFRQLVSKTDELAEFINKEWEHEFQDEQCQAVQLSKWGFYCGLSILVTTASQLVAPVGSNPEDCPLDSLTVKGFWVRLVIYSPLILCGVLLVLFRVYISSLTSHKLRHSYSSIATVFIVTIFAGQHYLNLMRAAMIVRGGGRVVTHGRGADKCRRLAHVKVSMDFSGTLPVRKCVDENLLRSVTESPFLFTVGCETAVADATFPRQTEILFLFVFMRCSWHTALKGSLSCTVLSILCHVAAGSVGRHMYYRVGMLLVQGVLAATVCLVSTRESRAVFQRIKAFKLASRKSCSLLHTLIPPNVLARLTAHSHDMGILATDISQCTVMFCSLVSADTLANEDEDVGQGVEEDVGKFHMLHHVCLDFDEAVKQSRLYKYQHVGQWYIIACPNAAEPFPSVRPGTGEAWTGGGMGGAEGGEREPTYATEMTKLAQKLVSIARCHGFLLKVGIHNGSAAGAVIGKLRAFYCIYGETVNIASRLCACAEPGRVRVSEGFVSRVLAEQPKGEGVMPGAAGSACQQELQASSQEHHASSQEHEASMRDGGGQGGAGAEAGVAVLEWKSRGQTVLKGFAQSQETFDLQTEAGDSSKGGQDESTGAARSSVFNVDAYTRRRSLGVGSFRFKAEGGSDYLSDLNEMLSEAEAWNVDATTLVEEAEEREEASNNAKTLAVAALVMHMLGVVVQCLFVVDPEWAHDGELQGLRGEGKTLAHTFIIVRRLMIFSVLGHGAVSLCLGMVVLCGNTRWMQAAGAGLGALRILWLLSSIGISTLWPPTNYTLVFPVLYSLSQFLLVPHNAPSLGPMFALTIAVCAVAFYRLRETAGPAFILRSMATAVGVWMLNVLENDIRSRQNLVQQVLSTKMKRFDSILDDLFPLNFDQQLLPASELLKTLSFYGMDGVRLCHSREALVLQLDLCGFTAFSQKLQPMELAQALHHIFSVFDKEVLRANFFKMDTVGDAYVVAAWLPSAEGGGEAGSAPYGARTTGGAVAEAEAKQKLVDKLCTTMLHLAGRMLRCIQGFTTKDGHTISARIGISAGNVVVGTLGSLQPRVHVRGQGMRTAAWLEQTGRPGMANISDVFLDLLSSGRYQQICRSLRWRTAALAGVAEGVGMAQPWEGVRRRRHRRASGASGVSEAGGTYVGKEAGVTDCFGKSELLGDVPTRDTCAAGLHLSDDGVTNFFGIDESLGGGAQAYGPQEDADDGSEEELQRELAAISHALAPFLHPWEPEQVQTTHFRPEMRGQRLSRSILLRPPPLL